MRKVFLLLAAFAVQLFMASAVQAQACTNVAGFASNCVNSVPVLALSNPIVSGGTATLTASVSQSGINVIYATGYYWSASQSQWVPFTLTGTAFPGTDGTTWLTNSASKSLSVPISAASNGLIYVVVWEYTYVNNVWTGPSCASAAGCWRIASATLTAAGDTTPPSVSVSHSPTSPITTSTSVAITATASDNVGVSSVEIFADGLPKKICASSPCAHASTYSAGTHTYYATARDPSNNQGRDPAGTGTKSFTVGTAPPTGAVAAFSGAEGAGAVTSGGRGGTICEVTTLADSGLGSLRDCVTRSGPRTVVFRVGGTIALSSQLSISSGQVTIAGQTAPGGGILINGKNVCGDPFRIAASDVVIRYIRVRVGAGCQPDQTGDGVAIYSGPIERVVLDHVSVSWALDEGFQLWANNGNGIRSITLSNSIIAEGLAGHSTAIIAGANAQSWGDAITDIDIHHSLIMSNSHRNPLLKNRNARFVNNIVYNWGFYAYQALGGTHDIIGNRFKAGPLDPGVHEIQIGTSSSENSATASVYVVGNQGPNNANPAADNWPMVRAVSGENGAEVGLLSLSFRRSSPQAALSFPIVAEPVTTLESSLLPMVGASQRLDCNGNWVVNRDAVDTRLINEYNAGTGKIPATETEVGGFPTIASGTPCADSDRDGMPDSWETAKGLNPNSAADGAQFAANGYTNLENYLNGS